MKTRSEILSVQPGDLKFTFEVGKQLPCLLKLINNTEDPVAFKVKTTAPKKYCVRPNTGLVHPGVPCDVTVTMQAQQEIPSDLQCKDKFLVQSVVAQGLSDGDVTPELFNKQPGKEVFEAKLKVIYVLPAPAPAPSPPPSQAQPVFSMAELLNVPASPYTSDQNAYDSAKDMEHEKTRLAEMRAQLAKLNEEKHQAIAKSQQLQAEIASITRMSSQQTNRSGFPVWFVLVVGLLGIIIGYILS